MRRRIVMLITTLALSTMMLAGCGNGKNNNSVTSSATQEPEAEKTAGPVVNEDDSDYDESDMTGDDDGVVGDVVDDAADVVDDVADDVSVRTRVNGLGEGPGFHPGLQLRDGDQRQQRHVRAAALDGVEQRLVLQVADENVFFMFRQRLVVNAIAGDVNLFRAPEEGELLFNQLFKDVVFLLIVAGHVNRLAKKHWLKQLIVFRL